MNFPPKYFDEFLFSASIILSTLLAFPLAEGWLPPNLGTELIFMYLMSSAIIGYCMIIGRILK